MTLDWAWFLGFEGAAAVIGVLAVGVGVGYWARGVFEPAIDVLKEKVRRLEAYNKELAGRERQLRTDLGNAKTQLDRYGSIREALFGGEDELWKLRQVQPPDRYVQKLAASRPRILTIANSKGGVGKTTLSTNLVAYFAKKRHMRVLAIDLDYQGSMTETLLQASGQEFIGSVIDDLLSGTRGGGDVKQLARSLHPILPTASLLASGFELLQLENRLMLKWLLHETDEDIRFALGQCLMHDAVQGAYDVVIIDAPPRMTTAMVNALSCSHAIVVPTVPDLLSVPAVGRFLKQVAKLKPDLNPALTIAGVVVNLTQRASLSQNEIDAIARIDDTFAYNRLDSHIFETNIPRLADLSKAAGESIAYLKAPAFREAFMDPLGDEIARKLGLGVKRESATDA